MKAIDFDERREKKYVLVEFPYPSGSGLHVGHAFSFVATDVYARYQRALGKNVLFPMGWDAFGLPTENYAIRTGISPQKATKENTETFKRQMKALGLSFDWNREINTTDPEYYKWTQWIFIKLWEKGLAEKQEMPINWCPSCKIGLANEEVIDGNCERCGAITEKRNISQWVVKITEYADRLLEGLKETEFIDKVKAAQVNWINKSVGAKIKFQISNTKCQIRELEVFTTRPDTLEGATFMVVAPEHPLVTEITNAPPTAKAVLRASKCQIPNEEIEKIREYVSRAVKKDEVERGNVDREKTGVFSGLMAINPFTKKEIPIWIADYVLMGYGTGAIMCVPSHDERDKEFALKFGLEINETYVPDEKMWQWIEEMGVGEKAVTYHLRDWIFSRQHYWGEPIPMVKCDECGFVPVLESELPVVLPEVEKYQPTDTGESPLANIEDWVKTVCPKCGGEARRETDTMPNWAGSDWYFLRYIDSHNDKALADMGKMKYWMPVDVYVGGDEHNTLHLLYSRFIYQFLWDLGVVPKEYPEPYIKRLSHGLILGSDGQKMSKSRGNVINPDEMVAKYGADVLRMYLMFMGPFDATMAWNERTLMGVKRFVDRMRKYLDSDVGETNDVGRRAINKLIKKVGDDLSVFKFNTVVAKLMEILNDLSDGKAVLGREDKKRLLVVMWPMAPFLVEEYVEKWGGVENVWPKFDGSLMSDEVMKIAVQVNGKLRGVIEVDADEGEEKIKQMAMEMESVKKWIGGGVKKVIYIKGRMVSLVV